MSSCSRPRTKAPRSIRNRGNGRISPSASAEIVAGLDDVLIQILLLLPLKSLLRSKRVSKHWRSLITNPDFSHRFLKSNHPLPISGLFVQGTRNIKYGFVPLDDRGDDANSQRVSLSLPLQFADHPTGMVIMQSTNGLLLCKCSCPPNEFDTNYYVYNPTTKQNTLLPRTLNSAPLALAFDPSKSPHYEVFSLTLLYDDLYNIEVYSSNEGPWRKLLSVPSFAVPLDIVQRCNTIFWNGAVLWFSPDSRECLSFDISEEKIKMIPFPNFDQDEEEEEEELNIKYGFVDESRGNLYFIEVNNMSPFNLPVFEMERDGSSWSLKHNIDLEPLAAALPKIIITDQDGMQSHDFSIIGYVNEEKDADSYIVLHILNEAVVKYNFNNKTFKKLCGLVDGAPGNRLYGYRNSFPFIESLANV